MPVQERDYLKSGQAPAAAKTPAWLAKLNELGERHATAIIAVSTGLIILIVLLFAKGAYDRSQAQRAQTELASAQTVDALKTLKTKYGSTPAAPLISYRLAGELYDEGKPAESLAEYQEFRRRWPGHALSDR
ncbi:MAG TPA: hypothetical protein VEJ18_16740, partial [Planctomycetota bacterium]|nr:hypothetical protein [Planctomycetota bacterium]